MNSSNINFRGVPPGTHKIEEEGRLKERTTFGEKKGLKIKRRTKSEVAEKVKNMALNKILATNLAPTEKIKKLQASIKIQKKEAYLYVAENYLKRMKDKNLNVTQKYELLEKTFPNMSYEDKLRVIINDTVVFGPQAINDQEQAKNFADEFLGGCPPPIKNVPMLLIGQKLSGSADSEDALIIFRTWALSRAVKNYKPQEALRTVERTIETINSGQVTGKEKNRKTQELLHDICYFYRKKFFKKLADLATLKIKPKNKEDFDLKSALNKAREKFDLQGEKLVSKLEENFNKSLNDAFKTFHSTKLVVKMDQKEWNAIQHRDLVIIRLHPHRIQTGFLS